MDLEAKVELVKRNTEEIVTLNELKNLLETNSSPKAYWGFECSG
jgi:tyrosyl-tRNA synthetase